MKKKFYVISYDIKDDKRRTRVFKIMRNFGTRVQFSVFECILSDEKMQELHDKIEKTIKTDEDSVRIYYIPESLKPKIKIIGVGEVVRDQNYFVV